VIDNNSFANDNFSVSYFETEGYTESA